MSLLGEHAVGLQLAVWWPAEGQWQYAKVRHVPRHVACAVHAMLGEHAVGLQLPVWWPAEGQWQ